MNSEKVPWGFKKTGDNTSGNRYIRIGTKNRYIHRRIMEEYLGRKLLKTEHVHHINGNPKDNHIENLKVVSNVEHARIHKSNN